MELKPGDREAFADALYPFYHRAGLLSRWKGDLAYLWAAYERTEELYHKNLAKMDAVRLVIFAEAPFFGAGGVYIYNPEARHTNFLWPSDLAGIAGYDTGQLKKPEYLSLLRQLGILVVDIFPYALNNDDTGLVYKKRKGSTAVELTSSQKRQLAGAVQDFHLRPKLEQIADKGRRSVRFCARYNPIGRIARELYPDLLEELGFASSEFAAVSMQGGMVDKDRLKDEYEAAIGGA